MMMTLCGLPSLTRSRQGFFSRSPAECGRDFQTEILSQEPRTAYERQGFLLPFIALLNRNPQNLRPFLMSALTTFVTSTE